MDHSAEFKGFDGLEFRTLVNRFALHKVLKVVAWGKFTSDERIVVQRVAFVLELFHKRSSTQYNSRFKNNFLTEI